MTATTTEVLTIAAKEIGNYYPRPNGKSKYGLWYEKKKGVKGFATAPWCAMFVSWVADQAGATDIIPIFAYTPSGADWFKKRKQWYTKGKPGDIVFFKFSGNRIHHVGIVEKVNANGSYTVIEGNTSGTAGGSQRNGGVVARKIRKSGIVGFGRPQYSTEQKWDSINVVPSNVTVHTKTVLRKEPYLKAKQGAIITVGKEVSINAYVYNTTENTKWLKTTSGEFMFAERVTFGGFSGSRTIIAKETSERFLPTRNSTKGKAYKKDSKIKSIGSLQEAEGKKETWLITDALRFIRLETTQETKPVKQIESTILTQNCASGHPNWVSRVKVLGQVIMDSNAEFVVCQELYAGQRPHLFNLIKSKYELAAVREGRVIFYRKDIWTTVGAAFWQNVGVGGKKKPVVVRKFKRIADGYKVDIANLHLSYETTTAGSQDRVAELNNILKALQSKFADDVDIIAGDYNSPAGGTTRPDAILPVMVTGGYKDLGQETKPKNGRGEYHLDRVFGPKSSSTGLSTNIIKHKGSDHNGVLVTFKFQASV